MTRHFGPDDDDQAAYDWLTRHQHAMTQSLDDLLDTEAGLREILLHSHHYTATDNLDTVLDIEAGLAAILPTPQTSPADTHDAAPHRTDTTGRFGTLSPAVRMTLRSNPDVKKTSQALALAFARDRDLARARDRDLAFDLVRDLAFELVRELDHVLARARDRARDHIHPRDRALVRVLALDRVHDLAVELARSLDLALDRALAHDRDRSLTHVRAIAHDLDLDLDRVRAFVRGLDPDFVRVRVRALALGLARDFDRAIGIARDLNRVCAIARDLALARDLDRVLGLARDLNAARDLIVEIRTAEVGRAIGLALRREPLLLDKDSLHTLLNDFTSTDLSNTDLTGIDLNGVRWSERTTRWPPTINIEDLKARSDETPPGSGTWIVRSGTATIRDHAER